MTLSLSAARGPGARCAEGWRGEGRRSGGLLGGAPLLVLGFLACSPDVTREDITLGVSLPYQVDDLDPHRHSRVSSFTVLEHLYEPLVERDRSLSIRPGLALRWSNPDDVTWVFHLDPRARFHDGRPVEADDVVATFERLLSRRDLGISGYLPQVEGARALGPRQVELRTRTPAGVLLGKLTSVAIVPRHPPPGGFASAENGSGRYRLVEWEPGRIARMVRNEQYRGDRPEVREVVFRMGRTDAQSVEDLVAGRSQIARFGSPAALSALAGRRGLRALVNGGLYVTYLSFDLRPRAPSGSRSPFLDQRVRHALDLGLDRRQLAREGSFPISQPLPPSVFGHDPAITVPAADPAGARRLLAEAGYPRGLRYTLLAPARLAPQARATQAALAPAGIALDLRVAPDDEFYDTIRREAGVLFLSRFGCSGGDGGELFDMAIHSPDDRKRFGTSNYGGFSDAELDRMIEASSTLLSAADRRAALQAISRRVMDRFVWIPLTVDQDAYGLDTRLRFLPRLDGHVRAWEVTREP